MTYTRLVLLCLLLPALTFVYFLYTYLKKENIFYVYKLFIVNGLTVLVKRCRTILTLDLIV